MLLLALFLNHNHSLHNRHVHNYNYLHQVSQPISTMLPMWQASNLQLM